MNRLVLFLFVRQKKKKKRIESSRNKDSGEIPKGLILWMKHLEFFCMVFLQNVLGEL